MDVKIFFASLGIACALVSYIFYFRDIYLGKTRPHAFSWLIWGTMAVVIFAGQVSDGAASGSWVLGVSMFVDLFIFFLALKWGEKEIVFIDWVSLVGAIVAIVLWPLTGTPLWSVLVAMIIDFLGFLPTYRKTFYKPYQENISMYILSGLKFVCVVAAIGHYSLVTTLYPVFLIFENVAFTTMMVVRRRIIPRV